MRKICTIWLLLLFCSPERKNPFDPKSPYYKPPAIISGSVLSIKRKPISNAFVFLEPENKGTFTDKEGVFYFENLNKGNKKIFVQKENYSPCSISFYLKNGEIKELNFYMNGLPIIDTPKLYSVHLSRWWPIEDLYWAEIKTSVSDPDGFVDIDSVWFVIDEINMSLTMEYNPDSQFFFKKIPSESLPSGKLDELIGKEFSFFAKDKQNGIGKFSPAYIFRIIEEIPQPISPSSYDTVGPTPEFIWKRFYTYYEFTYKIEIYRLNSGYPVLLKSIPGFAPEDTSFILNDSLNAGDYYWRLFYIDNYGNRSISKPYVFYVQ